MTYKLHKAEYLRHDSKSVLVEVLDCEGNVIKAVKVYGNRKTAKKKAEALIKELSNS